MGFNIPQREENSHKGTFGKVLNVAGSDYMTGAAYLSSVSALKIGCGYCFLASTERVIDAVAAQTQNVVFVPLSKIKEQKPDVISIGCGLSVTDDTTRILKDTLEYFHDIPTIIDADGLNILAKTEVNLPSKLVLTPHYMEAARLLNISVENIQNTPGIHATEISKKYNCITVMKGHPTIVSKYDEEFYINDTGNSALAKAGSGDVLTGMIAGLAAQKMDLYEAAKLAVHLHGLCGDLASKDLTEYSVMAQDIIDYIPQAIKTLIYP